MNSYILSIFQILSQLFFIVKKSQIRASSHLRYNKNITIQDSDEKKGSRNFFKIKGYLNKKVKKIALQKSNIHTIVSDKIQQQPKNLNTALQTKKE